MTKEAMRDAANELEDAPEPDISPFGVPQVTSGYPLEIDEEAAIDRILRDRDKQAR